jgi:hypothetical protein
MKPKPMVVLKNFTVPVVNQGTDQIMSRHLEAFEAFQAPRRPGITMH